MITIGADPEVFVADSETGEVQASQGVVKGTKLRPFPTEHGLVHRDNILAEMNVEPATTPTIFANNVQNVMNDLSLMLRENNKVIDVSSSHIIKPMYLEHFEARRFGCNANYNCWDLGKPHKPSAHSAGQLRTASGHIHIGCKHTDTESQIRLAKACEIHIGLPSISLDTDSRRRTLYGLSGSFRPKEYGIEYTVPSNFWLRSKYLMQWIFRAAINAIEMANYPQEYSSDVVQEIQDTINNCDQTAARALCGRFGVDYDI